MQHPVRGRRVFSRGFGEEPGNRDPFVGDIRSQWLSEPIDNSAESLREAVWQFVVRHQRKKLEKHVRRGNLNGLPNFLDIFRTLNGLLVTFNKRTVKGVPVIPHPFVTTGIMKNLDLLMGAVDTEGDYVPGYINSINANFQGDRELVRERLLRSAFRKSCARRSRP